MLLIALVVNLATTFGVGPDTDTVPLPGPWNVSIQSGVGQVENDVVNMWRLRFGYTHEDTRLQLAVPLWLQPWQQNADGGVLRRSYGQWSNLETYLGFLETLDVQGFNDALRLHAGALTQEALGYGVLVDQYTSSLDPLQPRAGMRVDAQLRNTHVTALVDRVSQPRLVALGVVHQPAFVRSERLSLALEIAIDPNAPRGRMSRGVAGGGDLSAAWRLLTWSNSALALYAAAAVLNDTAFGGHFGARFELARPRSLQQWPASLVLRIEAVNAGANYQPGYFDVAYSTERWATSYSSGLPKRSMSTAGYWGARFLADGRLGPWRLGLWTTTDFANQTKLALMGRYQAGRVSVGGMVLNRSMTDPALYALGDIALRIYDGIFVFTSYAHTWRRELLQTTVHGASIWQVGIGYSAASD